MVLVQNKSQNTYGHIFTIVCLQPWVENLMGDLFVYSFGTFNTVSCGY